VPSGKLNSYQTITRRALSKISPHWRLSKKLDFAKVVTIGPQ